ncbi:MAG: MgtC/SapB family protein, partial [Butyrivibrio sp.]|nr:MgtC/SapB family protein [Butyrivibrio sp.]
MAYVTQFLDIVHGFSLFGITIRFIFVTIVGSVVGIDREMKNRSAGIKTHVLVCLGACMVSTTSQYVSIMFQGVAGDINRLGAQVISGVGFLGVGTILVTGKNQVRGLTTAAGLWVCACVGLAAGMGFIEGATIALLFIIFTLKILNLVDNKIHMYAKNFELYIEFENTKSVRFFIDDMHKKDISIYELSVNKSDIKGQGPIAIVRVGVSNIKDRPAFIDNLREYEY